MNARSSQGQILVLVLLVVLVGLTIGLSIASRTISNIKNSADLDQSNRAFSAAEAGVEKALSAIKSGQSCGSNACAPTLSGIDSVQVSVVPAGGTTSAFGIPNLQQDEVIQLNLQGYTGSTFDLYWGTKGNSTTGASASPAAVVSVVYSNAGTYGLGKAPIDNFAASRGNNFYNNPTIDPTVASPGLTLQDGTVHNDYGFKYTINLSSASPNRLVPAGSVPILARVRLMYCCSTPTQIAFAPTGAGVTLPQQGQQITSTAVAGGKQRTVKVFKSNATLPAIFDYALFNGSTSSLTK